ncbi:MAG: hypothetical protein JOZ41_18800 [Chloroflexi bacterium]|nr:hypothetical protein [Chloroflexota bacterium]
MDLKGRFWVGGLLCVALCAGCGSSAGGKPSPAWPVLGASERSVDAAWSGGRAPDCRQENLELTCRYFYEGVRVAVSFDQHRLAEQFQTAVVTGGSIDLWRFLTSLVPRGSRRLSCRSVPHSSGGGTARACLYRFKRDMIVAYFPHPADQDDGGLVTYDFEEYKDIEQ